MEADMVFSQWRSATDKQPEGYVHIKTVYEAVVSDTFAEVVAAVRATDDEDRRRAIKKILPAWSFSGVFATRGDDNLAQHSGLLCLDYDHLENVEELFQKACKMSTAALVFHSPSGDGVKVVVRLEDAPKDAQEHIAAWQVLDEAATRHLGEASDPKCKNVERLCFASYDPEAHFNPQARPVSWRKAANKVRPSRIVRSHIDRHSARLHEHVGDSNPMRALSALRYLDVPQDYEDWFKLCVAAKRAGVSLEDVEEWSSGGAKYVQDEVRDQWNTPSWEEGSYGPASLYKMAWTAGWRGPVQERGKHPAKTRKPKLDQSLTKPAASHRPKFSDRSLSDVDRKYKRGCVEELDEWGNVCGEAPDYYDPIKEEFLCKKHNKIGEAV